MEAHHSAAGTEFDPREHINRLRNGCLLVARDLADPNFTATVVLLCQHGEEGSYGLILNRPCHMPLSEIFENSAELWPGGGPGQRSLKIHIGGPVQTQELQVLQVTDDPVEEALQVVPKVHLGGRWNDLRGLLEMDERTTRLFLGYSGWGADQLAYEINLHAWEVWEVDVAKILSGPQNSLIGDPGQIKGYLASL